MITETTLSTVSTRRSDAGGDVAVPEAERIGSEGRDELKRSEVHRDWRKGSAVGSIGDGRKHV
jgi:hypothetical protein